MFGLNLTLFYYCLLLYCTHLLLQVLCPRDVLEMVEIVTVKIRTRNVPLICFDGCLFGFLYIYRSIFQAGWATDRHPQHEDEKWGRLRSLRDDVNKALELARGAKILGASLEGQVNAGLASCLVPSTFYVSGIFLGGGREVSNPLPIVCLVYC